MAASGLDTGGSCQPRPWKVRVCARALRGAGSAGQTFPGVRRAVAAFAEQTGLQSHAFSRYLHPHTIFNPAEPRGYALLCRQAEPPLKRGPRGDAAEPIELRTRSGRDGFFFFWRPAVLAESRPSLGSPSAPAPAPLVKAGATVK